MGHAEVVKGVSFLLRLTVAADDGSGGWSARPGRRKPHTASRNWRGTVHADSPGGKCVGTAGRSGSVSFRIAAPVAPSRIELTPAIFR